MEDLNIEKMSELKHAMGEGQYPLTENYIKIEFIK